MKIVMKFVNKNKDASLFFFHVDLYNLEGTTNLSDFRKSETIFKIKPFDYLISFEYKMTIFRLLIR